MKNYVLTITFFLCYPNQGGIYNERNNHKI